MFTQQIANILSSLQQANVDPAVVDAFAQLGNCQAPLEHRGEARFQQEWPSAPPVGWNTPQVDVIAPLKASNRGGRVIPGSRIIRRGLAADFEGPVRILGDLVLAPLPPPKGNPNMPHGPNAGPSIYVYNTTTGTAATITALYPAIASGTINTRSTTTYGSGSANIYTLTAMSVMEKPQLVNVVNPLSYEIPSGTHMVVGKVTRGNDVAYVILEVDGTFEPAYAVRNNADQVVTDTGAAVTVVLDTAIHTYPSGTSVFELSSNEITIKKSGIYSFKWNVPIQPVANSSYAVVWLEEGGTAIPGANSDVMWSLNSTQMTGVAGTIDHVVDVSGGNKTYRLRISTGNSIEVKGEAVDASLSYGGYTRLDIHFVRSL